MEHKILTIHDLAELLRVHPSTCYRLIKYRHLPCFKIGSDLRFNLEQINQWIELRSVGRYEPAAR